MSFCISVAMNTKQQTIGGIVMKTKVNKIMFMFVGMFVFTSTQAMAISKPGWERPIYSAQMEKIDARGYFADAQNIRLTLTQLDESETPTGMSLGYLNTRVPMSDDYTRMDLTITEKRDIGCGSVQYVAQLLVPQYHIESYDKSIDNQHRFTVVLTDHTHRICRDYRPYRWEASVREGSGFCGTMDATMEIRGNPRGVFTIQSSVEE